MEIYKIVHLITAEYLPLKASQEHTEHFYKLTLYWEIKQVSTSLKDCDHIKSDCIL